MKKEQQKVREVTISKEWFERLAALSDMVEKSQGQRREQYIAMLMGYASSAKTILKYF